MACGFTEYFANHWALKIACPLVCGLSLLGLPPDALVCWCLPVIFCCTRISLRISSNQVDRGRAWLVTLKHMCWVWIIPLCHLSTVSVSTSTIHCCIPLQPSSWGSYKSNVSLVGDWSLWPYSFQLHSRGQLGFTIILPLPLFKMEHKVLSLLTNLSNLLVKTRVKKKPPWVSTGLPRWWNPAVIEEHFTSGSVWETWHREDVVS